MIKNKIKELLSISIMLLSLFLFANPVIDTNFSDTGSEKVSDFENETEHDQEDDKEKKEFTFLNTFSFYTLFTCKEKSVSDVCLHSHHTNSSLYKPPILHS